MRKLIGPVIALALLACSSNESADNAINVENLTAENLVADEVATNDTAPANSSASVADSNEIIYCRRVLRDARRSECALYERAWNNLEQGSGAVSAPSSMTRGDTATIRLAISANAADGEGQPSAEDLLGGKSTQPVIPVQVSAKMAAQLSGVGFSIKPDGIVEQELSVTRGALWEWNVTALKSPEHSLLARVFVRVKDPDGEKTRLLTSEEVPIEVRVTAGQTIGDYLDASEAWLGRGTNWLKALAAFIAAIGAVALAVRQLRSGRKKHAQ